MRVRMAKDTQAEGSSPKGESGAALKDFVLVKTTRRPGKYDVQRFAVDVRALDVANNLWCNWVLFQTFEDGTFKELSSGGLGFAKRSIRKFAATDAI